jgi:hypothetical protein
VSQDIGERAGISLGECHLGKLPYHSLSRGGKTLAQVSSLLMRVPLLHKPEMKMMVIFFRPRALTRPNSASIPAREAL